MRWKHHNACVRRPLSPFPASPLPNPPHPPPGTYHHRAVHFFADSTKAKFELGWQPQHSLQKDAKSLVDEYVKTGRINKSIDFAVDDRILSAQRVYA